METNEPRIYRIPTENLDGLTESITKLAKRADKLGVPAPAIAIVGTDEVVSADGAVETVRCYTLVTVTGEAPCYDGWSMLAVIDLDVEDEPGQPHVVHVIGDTISDPTWAYESDRCDHCTQTPRGRRKVVVVEHDGGDRKVVGTTCLKDFLGHQSPSTIAAWAEVLATLDDLAESYEDEGRGGHVELRFEPHSFLALVACIIDIDGWTPRSAQTGSPTADTALMVARPFSKSDREAAEYYTKQLTDEHVAEADAAMEWAQAVEPTNDYLANVLAVANKAGWRYKDVGLGASIMSAYRREQERLVLRKLQNTNYADSAFVGEEKAKIEFDGTITYVNSIETQYGSTLLVKILTTDGNLFVWWCSGRFDNEVGDQITGKATVKRHEERDGIKQTTITRAKLTTKETV